MDAQYELKLIECLGLLEAGEPLEAVLARFPEDAASLRPQLELAALLPNLRSEPSEPARQAARRAFLNQAHTLREPARPRWLGLPARLVPALLAVLVALFTLSGAVVASNGALPDQALYSVKRGVEDTQLLLASQERQASLRANFGQRRRDEVQQLLAGQRAAAVAFEGVIETIDAGSWRVSGIVAQLTPATIVRGTPQVGARAQVQGHTVGGALQADLIEVVPGSAPPPTATPLPSATARASATPRPSATPTALPSATPRPTRTPTATPSATPRPTARPTRAPTAVPEPPTATPVPPAPTADNNQNDNNNGGGDDNSNQNGNDNNNGGGDDNSNQNDNSGSGNDNQNDNDNGGGDDNGNQNDNSGGNDNQNGNDNGGGGDDNSNQNDNQNDNDNGGSGGGNDNQNDNGSDGGSGQGSGGGNDNQNDNGGSGGGNDNQNDNGD